MSNPYATSDDLFAAMDRRSALELSGDDNRHEGQPAHINALLDMQASELDSVLQGRYGSVPLSVTPVPPILTKWVVAKTQRALFARRGSIPKEVQAESEWADEWLQKLMDNKVGIPGLPGPSRVQPALQDSNYTDGRSRFDWIFNQHPSKTGPSGGR